MMHLSISSKRGLLAAIWFGINALTLIAFVVTLCFGISENSINQDIEFYKEYYKNYQEGGSGDKGGNNNQNNVDPELAITSRAMAFCAMWTAVLAVLLNIFGTVILGYQSPTGQYYTCCSSEVHKTTPITLGGFIGALLMFSALTLICAVLFGEFLVLDYRDSDRNEEQQQQQQPFFSIRRASLAFSILCLCMGIMYGGFAIMVFSYSNHVLDELDADEMDETKMMIMVPDGGGGGTSLYNKSSIHTGGSLGTPVMSPSSRLSSKPPPSSSHSFMRPHDAMFHKHTHHPGGSLAGSYTAPSAGTGGGSSAPTGTMA